MLLTLGALAQEAVKSEKTAHTRNIILGLLDVIKCLSPESVIWRRGIVPCPEVEVGDAAVHVVICASLGLTESDSPGDS